MRAGINPKTGESEIFLTADEAEQMKDMVRRGVIAPATCLP